MTAAAANQPSHPRWWLRLLVWVLVVAASLLAITAVQVAHTASLQELHPSDAIVVFGAAEYSGRPSPVLRARLDHAFNLFQRHVSPVVITTGGAGEDPKYTEGGVGRDYLMHRGIPEASLIAETLGWDTAHSAERVGVIMRANCMRSCIAVSDEYHVFRIRKLLEHEGLKVYVAPRPDSRPRSALLRTQAVVREAGSYIVWRLRLLV